MTRFQKVLAILLAGFLLVAVYDRVNKYRHEKAAADAAASQELRDGLYRCENEIPYPIALGRTTQQHEEDMQVYIAARNVCKKFWIPGYPQ